MDQDKKMIIAGFDPGSLITGFGLVALEQDGTISHIAQGVIRLNPKDRLEDRLKSLAQDLSKILTNYSPKVAIVENVFSYKNLRSALVLAQARGAIIATLGLFDIPTHDLTPTAIKLIITGRGRAEKFQVAEMVALELKIKAPSSQDASDALAAAMALGLKLKKSL